MTTLHIVRQSAFNTNDYAQCLQVLGDNDVIVFIDDGCYNLHHHLTNNLIDNLNNNLSKSNVSAINIKLKVIAQHANARAIKINEAVVSKIEMTDLVSLTFENDRVITWQ
ncbi:sulfurtransferase complex subunit TusB [Colwellia sp. 4_MG-2023]|jgi:tRNA 2-thiouridine synthesizing protein B|uniref:sulfurtransferase complex subunit TusB n=1 Tax=unclassified Colwellia TaxID=196834 RepID=UPI001C07F112|nr:MULTISPECIES: sulfurtransferase complex subunit TusB [unclassified Colwellia]MBU2926476.1 sulfurtransferase complex subunit TusB [Colwellia sp. C2M11]MDO6508073.1 sulfurtransferase complex subunit TusB [Colwellia sp. 5_MG-2023]MDO6556748.1 sulfurtransferase complex subunit TusB [Colwellia sp. 4_MG-2023]MDO6652514.1 sulfurtransferase complex subunit TusB [Colwellia sp. 3_MG-2023]MDO6665115.1 sulfurtransferase complex subunit TusB [Colwellia sp. 2_MG-2023]